MACDRTSSFWFSLHRSWRSAGVRLAIASCNGLFPIGLIAKVVGFAAATDVGDG